MVNWILKAILKCWNNVLVENEKNDATVLH